MVGFFKYHKLVEHLPHENNEQDSTPIEENKQRHTEICALFADNLELPLPLIEKVIPEKVDDRVYKWFESSPKKLDECADALVFVHLTDYYPEDSYLMSSQSATHKDTLETKAQNYAAYRMTVHGSISYPVLGHEWGSWSDKRYAIVAPFKGMAPSIRGYDLQDSYTVGPTKLPKGTRIVTFDPSRENSPEIQAVVLSKTNVQKELISNGIIDQATIQEISIKYAQQHLDTDEMSLRKRCVNNDWTVKVEELRALIDQTDPLYEVIQKAPTLQVSRTIDSPLHYETLKEIMRMGKVPLVHKKTGNYFDNFKNVESPWKNSGLDKFLHEQYNKGNPFITDEFIRESDIPHHHYETVWGDIENLWKVCTENSRKNPAYSGVVAEISELPKQEQIPAALKTIRPGGEIWNRALIGSWNSPKLLIYTYNTLHALEKDLSSM